MLTRTSISMAPYVSKLGVMQLTVLWFTKVPGTITSFFPDPKRTSILLESSNQGLTLVHVRAQLEQLQDTFMADTVDGRAQVELKWERV